MPRFIVFLLVLGCFWANSLAVQVVPLSIEELTTRSALIVRATVASKSCLRDDRGRIYTEIELQVSEVWKGAHAGSKLTVVQSGGTLGDQRVVVSGEVNYVPGEAVVAFLVLNPKGQAVTLALMQGKFELLKDVATGATLARNPFHGNEAASPVAGGGGSVTKSAVAAKPALTVEELKRRVQTVGGTR